MKSASVAEIDRMEKSLIRSGVSAEYLMENVSRRMAEIIRSQYGEQGKCIAYLGKGNNAGDALVVLRWLREWGWTISVRLAYPDRDTWSSLLQLQWERLGEMRKEEGVDETGPIVLLDGLVGLGAKGPLTGGCARLAQEMNQRRASGRCITIAIDFPSGINGDTGEIYEGAVMADISLVVGGMKKGLLSDLSTGHVGRIYTLPLMGMNVEGDEEVVDPEYFAALSGRRPYEWYKGSAGRVAVIAGSPGMIGAARLCSESALKAGAGMVTLFALPEIYSLLATTLRPEIMVKPVSAYCEIPIQNYDTLLIGPGLGTPEGKIKEDLLYVIDQACRQKISLVLDADGLNLFSRERALHALYEKTILTPHVGEMERLLPRRKPESRREWCERFMTQCPAVLLLKGARSLICQRAHVIRYNSTGGPGMGTAGQGDVLAGVCAGLCAQGFIPHDAAAMGAWLCGRASELAMSEGMESEQSLTAGDTLEYLGRAFQSLFVNGF